jgi:hypothetical protein
MQHESGAFIEILAGIRTAIADQIEREAVDGEMAGQVVRVLNPASMLREKVSLAVEANQTGRQDAKHVQILAPCCRCFFEDLERIVKSRFLLLKAIWKARKWILTILGMLTFPYWGKTVKSIRCILRMLERSIQFIQTWFTIPAERKY